MTEEAKRAIHRALSDASVEMLLGNLRAADDKISEARAIVRAIPNTTAPELSSSPATSEELPHAPAKARHQLANVSEKYVCSRCYKILLAKPLLDTHIPAVSLPRHKNSTGEWCPAGGQRHYGPPV